MRKPPEPPDPAQSTLGGKILELVRARGLSIKGAADLLGMSRQQLWRIIQGDVPNPGVLTVQGIIRGLGWRMRDLFDGGDLVAGGARDEK